MQRVSFKVFTREVTKSSQRRGLPPRRTRQQGPLRTNFLSFPPARLTKEKLGLRPFLTVGEAEGGVWRTNSPTYWPTLEGDVVEERAP